jgi:outer membrane protein OmpA-like peptidoglycan-associated protein
MKKLNLPFALLLLFSVGSVIDSREAFANDQTYWGTNSGQIWKSGFGECWGGAMGRTDPTCGGAPVAAADPGPVMAAGPELDDDGDGVPNSEDICWTTPAGNRVDLYGCTISEEELMVSLQGVHFASDSSTLTSEAKSILDGAVGAINAKSSSQIDVMGHTDSRLSDSYNQSLSERRAKSVADYLASKGVSASSLNAKGMGEGSPVASNDTREGRAKNRRVEVIAR